MIPIVANSKVRKCGATRMRTVDTELLSERGGLIREDIPSGQNLKDVPCPWVGLPDRCPGPGHEPGGAKEEEARRVDVLTEGKEVAHRALEPVEHGKLCDGFHR